MFISISNFTRENILLGIFTAIDGEFKIRSNVFVV